MAIPFDIPSRFLGRYATGQLVRYGPILKDASNGQIVGHLQETGLARAVLRSTISNPFNPISAATSIGANVQIYRLDRKVVELQRMMGGLQHLQVLNLSMTALGIGISVLTFVLIRRELVAISEKLDTILTRFEQLRIREIKDLDNKLASALYNAELAQYDKGGRADFKWDAAGSELTGLIYDYRGRIRDCIQGDGSLMLLAHLLYGYSQAANAKTECHVLTNELVTAEKFSEDFAAESNALFDQVTARDMEKLTESDRAEDGKGLSSRDRLWRAASVLRSIREFQIRYETNVFLIRYLIENNIDGHAYVMQSREEKNSQLLVLDYSL